MSEDDGDKHMYELKDDEEQVEEEEEKEEEEASEEEETKTSHYTEDSEGTWGSYDLEESTEEGSEVERILRLGEKEVKYQKFLEELLKQPEKEKSEEAMEIFVDIPEISGEVTKKEEKEVLENSLTSEEKAYIKEMSASPKRYRDLDEIQDMNEFDRCDFFDETYYKMEECHFLIPVLMRGVLLKQGRLVNADSGPDEVDILMNGGKITDIAPTLEARKETTVILCKGMYIFPGGIDPHTHFAYEDENAKTAEDFYSGTLASIAGGTTTILDFVTPMPGESLYDAFDRYYEKSADKCVCDYGFHMVIRSWNEQVSQEMGALCTEKGINSFKFFMDYKGEFMLNDAELFQALKRCKNLGAIPMVHAENGLVVAENSKRLVSEGVTGPEGHHLARPEELEAEATFRACTIASQVQCPIYIVHIMTDGAAKVVRHQKSRNVHVFAETVPAAIGSVGAPKDCSLAIGAAYVTSPPISLNPANRAKIVQHLADGTLDTVGSNDCGYFTKDKEQLGEIDFTKIPIGVNGAEERMAILWQWGVNEKRISVQQFVDLTSTKAAKIFNLYPKKGHLTVGSDADVVVWNPFKQKSVNSRRHKQKCDYNIYNGMEITGNPEYVFVKGNCIFQNDRLKPVPGHGSYLKLSCHNHYIYGSKK